MSEAGRPSAGEALHRDGTSQSARASDALDPAGLAIDGRSTQDLLRFADEFARELLFYDAANRQAGRWDGLFTGISDHGEKNIPYEVVTEFLRRPEAFRSPEYRTLRRPHFVLLLVVLHLLETGRDALNGLARRHLDHYYRTVLRMRPKPPTPDRLFLLFETDAPIGAAEVPAGTRLAAGRDTAGVERIYRIERSVLVSRARVAKRMSVFVDKQVTGLADLRRRNIGGGAEKLLLDMLRLSLGDPAPGDPLPKYSDITADGQPANSRQVDIEALRALRALVRFAPESLGRSLSDFRRAMERKQARPNDEEVKKEIAALISNKKQPFATVDVDDIDAYYRAILALERYFHMPVESFAEMVGIDGNADATERHWRRVEAILLDAYRNRLYAQRRADLRKRREDATGGSGFAAVLAAALGDASKRDRAADLHRLESFVTSEDLREVQALATAESANDGMSNAQWEELYEILERAQRQREGRSEPVPLREEWFNLYACPEAEACRQDPGNKGAERWKTFGGPGPQAGAAAQLPEAIGWAIASPLLALTAGHREITLKLEFDAPLPEIGKPPPFTVKLSTAKAWIEPEFKILRTAAPPTLKVSLKIAADAAAVAPPPLPERFADCPCPVLKLMLRPVVPAYQSWRGLRLTRVGLGVQVGSFDDKLKLPGLSPLLLDGPAGVLDGKQPFEPFGPAPAGGSRLLVSHPDLLDKPLTGLRFRLQWLGAPASLNQHYAAYPIKDHDKFTVSVSLVDDGKPSASVEGATLFAKDDAREPHSITVLFAKDDARKPHSITIESHAVKIQPSPDDVALPPRLADWRRYLQLELKPNDFQHAMYPPLATMKSQQLVTALVSGTIGDVSAYLVLPPYTPKLESLVLDFAAEADLPIKTSDPGQATHRIFLVHPFGYEEIRSAASAPGIPFLPRYDDAGALHLGIADAHPPQILSLLFQMADGSADPETEHRPVRWSYLDADGWRSLDGEAILQDTTRGLINSGIVELALPVATPDRRLPPGLYWLRASIDRNTESVCDAVAIEAQAAAACFADQGNAPEHYRAPLPPASVKTLVDPVPGIAAVRQPFPSFGGRPAEQEADLNTRVSERLRHKRRAVAIWDYERLVLERFREVYKVKCVPAAAEPGLVRLIVIPDLRGRQFADPFEPRAPADLLADIHAFLSPLMPASARLVVSNPTYVQVLVRIAVRFRIAGNEGIDTARLVEDLNRYLAPWAFDEGADITIGRRIYANDIVAFVDRRSYVDFVGSTVLFSSSDDKRCTLIKDGDGSYVEASEPYCVLVAARHHEIDVIRDDVVRPEKFEGIGYMKIEYDFQVA